MSIPILPLEVWQSGTNENSIPANDNALRNEALARNAISKSVTDQPVSPSDGDTYVIPTGATGGQWSSFDPDDITIFRDGTWYAWAPVEGIRLTIGGDSNIYGGSSGWVVDGGEGSGTVTSVNVSGGTTGLIAVGGPVTTSGTITIEGTLALANGGTGASLADPNADRLFFWDDSAGSTAFLTLGTNLSITGTTLDASSSGGLTNWTDALSTTTPNGSVPVSSLTANNAATNVDAAIRPKGSGSFLLSIPDNLAAGGNKRGTNCIDLSLSRSLNTQVASGNNSIVIGTNVTATSIGSVAIGTGASSSATNSLALGVGTASGSGAVSLGSGTANTTNSATLGGSGATASGVHSVTVGGSGATASGAHSSTLGGQNCVANADFGVTIGGRSSSVRGCIGCVATAAPTFLVVASDTQKRTYTMLADTTNATAEPLTTNNSTASAANTVVLPNNSVYVVRGDLSARQQTTGDVKSWEFRCTIKRGINAAATSIVGTALVTVLDADAGASAWTLSLTADTTLGGLAISIAGEAAKNIKWAASLRSLENVTA